FADPNVVKVVLDASGHALYFSRSPIPYRRTTPANLAVYRHKGLYGYRRDFLERFVGWPPSVLEQTESLEQLRALENGARIKVLITNDDSIGLDTPEQAPLVERLLLAAAH
ncbi:MAG TPA: 3-deoxy-manno-octulosonate cytidylyltransferase, partial [Luteolibacter sp.]